MNLLNITTDVTNVTNYFTIFIKIIFFLNIYIYTHILFRILIKPTQAIYFPETTTTTTSQNIFSS